MSRKKKFNRKIIGGVCVKEVYTNEREADRAAASYNLLNETPQKKYLCNKCKMYHLTSRQDD